MEKFGITKKRAAGACIVTAAMLILTALADGGEEEIPSYYPALAIGLSAAGGVFCMIPVEFGRWISLALSVLLPPAALCALEYYTHVPQDLTLMILILNLLFFWILYGTMIFLSGSVRLGGCLATLVPMLFGLANYFVVQFRSSPIVPWDFFSIRTAASVSDNYSFTLTWRTVFVLFGFIWIMLLFSKSNVRFEKKKVRFAAAAAFAALMAVYVAGIQKSAVQDFFGMDTTLFTLNVLYRNNGIAAAFLGNLRFLNIEEPKGYSAQAVKELEDKARASVSGTVSSDVTDYPNVIVIVDEAFSDLSVWGDFATSEEVMPFFKSLQQEAVGGEAYVSVKGGNTANTEYELLTGDTMGFLPAGSVPYQQYINEALPNMTSYLKKLGYQTVAVHPYNASGWDRDEVYPYFGFDKFLSLKTFSSPEKYRGYVSDRSAFHKIIQEYQAKEPGERLFAFEVTMQNHGGYSKESPGFDIYLKMPEVTSKTTSVVATEKYLTLMNLTDKALEEMVAYFEQEEEPVVLLMLGDHQPSDYITNVIRRITRNGDDGTLKDAQTGYRVPFVIWSNYGLEHHYYEAVSVNYLGGLLMEAAGIPLTGYQQFLANLRETLPVINANVYMDAEGTFYGYGQKEYADLLNEYKMLQYSHLVDSKERDDSFFG